MLRVVVDPNVLLSALIAPAGTSDKAPRAVIARTAVVVSPQLLERFLQRASEDKFRRWFSVAVARELSDRLAALAEIVDDPMSVPRVIGDDPSDDYLVAVARHGGAQLLLTGDDGITGPSGTPLMCRTCRQPDFCTNLMTDGRPSGEPDMPSSA